MEDARAGASTTSTRNASATAVPLGDEILRLASENAALREAAEKGAAYITLLQERVRELEIERDAKEGTIAMAVARLGGTVEGHPTHRINFLQRIDELVRKEAGVAGERERIRLELKSLVKRAALHQHGWLVGALRGFAHRLESEKRDA